MSTPTQSESASKPRLCGSDHDPSVKDSRVSFANVSNTIATVKIGVNRKAFTIHLDLLTGSSPYFRKLFKGPSKETES
ncbi:hypothetical protein BU26DRAFT_599342 [Trematosphaeria pertusa]|uniref:BTB domain-containing protein n=1 Tax=Trematosphaeria pertusa TaxID=390896 RepID=A0A6A6J1F3_9PLEO|nr:uncharacterized protein BU26DRAFT_599342 [Trematosphaeria pertusa]KAF2256695.1 hypothetical protein BU26DRAFT_599342 [Trematosphaeria pertusa]